MKINSMGKSGNLFHSNHDLINKTLSCVYFYVNKSHCDFPRAAFPIKILGSADISYYLYDSYAKIIPI